MKAGFFRFRQTIVCLSNVGVSPSDNVATALLGVPAALPVRAGAARGNSRLPQLLEAAARTFADRGYAAASVREIVGSIGMLPGSLYCHFATKEELLVAVYARAVERICASVDEAVAPVRDPWARLEAAAVAHLQSLLDATDWSQVVIRVHPGDAPQVEARLTALRDAYESRWRTLVDALPLVRGTSRADLRLFLLGALNSSQAWYRPDGPRTPAQLARRCVALVRQGHAVNPRARTARRTS